MKTKFGCITLFFLCIFVFSTKCQTVMFLGNAQHTGVSNSTFPTKGTFKQLWKFKTRAQIFGSAVAYKGLIYFGCDDSCLYALNTKGQLQWKFKTNAKIRSTPAIKDGVLYINNYGGFLFALNAAHGNVIWKLKVQKDLPKMGYGLNYCTPKDTLIDDLWDFYASSPTIDQAKEVLYFGCGYSMYAVNIRRGSVLWRFNTPGVIHSTPAVYRNRIFFGCWDGKLYALNAKTGKKEWDYQTLPDNENHNLEGIQASPVAFDSTVVIGARDSYVYAFNTASGRLIWKQKFASTWMPSSFAYDGRYLYTGSSDIAKLLVLNKQDGTTIRSASTGTYTFSSPTLANGIAFIGSTNGALYAINVADGTVIDQFYTDGRLRNPCHVVSNNGSLNNDAFADLTGTQYATGVKYVQRLFTAGSILSTPATYANRVYFGSTDTNFYCVTLVRP